MSNPAFETEPDDNPLSSADYRPSPRSKQKHVMNSDSEK
jgi:hypothetical protein